MVGLIFIISGIIFIGAGFKLIKTKLFTGMIMGVFVINFAFVVQFGGAAGNVFSRDGYEVSSISGITVFFVWLIFLLGLITYYGIIYIKKDRLATLVTRQIANFISNRLIWFSATGYMLIKLYLYYLYEMDSIKSIDALNVNATFGYTESIVNSMAISFFMGGLIAWIIKLSLGESSVWLGFVMISLFVISALVGDIGIGVRRAGVLILILYFSLRYMSEGRVAKIGREMVICGAILAGIFIYYPFVRMNIRNPDIYEALSDGNMVGRNSAVSILFTPDTEVVSSGETAVVRRGVAELQCRLTEAQMDRGLLSHGLVISQSLGISLPRMIVGDKSNFNPDEVVAREFDLYPQLPYSILDLSLSPLLELQCDYGPAAPFLLAIILLFSFIASVFFLGRRFSPITKIFALQAIWNLISSTEASTSQIITSLRDLIFVAVMVETVNYILPKKKSIPSNFRGIISRDLEFNNKQ